MTGIHCSPGRLWTLLPMAIILALPLSAGLMAQSRVEVQSPAKATSTGLPSIFDLALRQQKSLPIQHEVFTTEAPEEESDQPAELSTDPTPGLDMDEWSQQPIPAYMKGNPYRLSYVGGDYTPPASERVDPALLTYWKLNRGLVDKTYGFVMLQGKITAAKIRRIEAIGVKLDTFHTFQSYSAIIPFKCIPVLLGSADVRWIGYAKPTQKVDPELAFEMAELDELKQATTKTHLFVNVYESDLGSASEFIQPWPLTETGDSQTPVVPTKVMMSNGRFQKALEGMGARVYAYHPDNKVFQLEAPYALVHKLTKLDWVHFVEPVYPVDLDHDRSTRQVGVDRVRSTTAVDGSSTVVGLLDSGAYMGGGGHYDLNKNGIGWNFNGGLGSVWNEAHGHGTHVLGTIGGTGTADKRYRGCAPAIGGSGTTRIFVGKVLGVATTATYPNNTLAAFTQFHKNYTSGTSTTPYPHVVNCSWGYGSRSSLGYYGTDNISLAVDSQSYLYNQLYVFSASNTGGSSTVEYLKSIRRPNVSKNAFTVASNADYRFTSGAKTVEAGQPYFSSGKGPTRDGRFKPNIMAPGRYIRSCKTLTKTGYTNAAGTSMAAPHVTGIAAGMMDHISSFKRRPYLAKAWLAAQTNPYRGFRSWTSTSTSYYYRQGMGQIDAYKSNYSNSSASGWSSGWAYGSFSSTTAGAYFTVTVPSDAKRTLFVLTFDEKAASPAATRSALADLDLYLDVSPYASGYNTGEYSGKRAYDTWDWYGNTGSIASVRGKTIRVKIYPRVRPKPGTYVRWAVSYLFPRGPDGSASTVSGTLSTTASKTYLKPNETIQLNAYVNVPKWIQTNSLVEMYNTGGFSVLKMQHRSVDNLLRTYTSTTLPGTGDSLLNWTLGHVPYFASSSHRSLTWDIRKASNGSSTLCFRLRSDNRAATYSSCRTLCVDGTAPPTILGLKSATHLVNVWRNTSTCTTTWTKATDVGCSGVDGLIYSLTYKTPGTPGSTPNIGATMTGKTLSVPTSISGYYFNLKVKDRSGNYSPTKSYGPIKVDTTKPIVTSVVVNSGATYTTSTTVSIKAAGTDTYSGIQYMQYSMNGSTWSPLYTYTTAARSMSLLSYGGSSAEGTRYVYVRLRDRAGNYSTAKYDTIYYLRLSKITSLSPTSIGNVTTGAITLTGSDFIGTIQVQFGSTLLGSSSQNWYFGYFRVISDTKMAVYPPQARSAAIYGIRFRNSAGWSNSKSVSLVHPGVPILATASSLKVPVTAYLVGHRGNMPATTVAIMSLSGSSGSSVIPGLVSLSHGGFFGPTFMLLPATLHSATTRAAVWPIPVPAHIKGTIYFQTILIDAAKPFVTPFKVSNLRTIKFL